MSTYKEGKKPLFGKMFAKVEVLKVDGDAIHFQQEDGQVFVFPATWANSGAVLSFARRAIGYVSAIKVENFEEAELEGSVVVFIKVGSNVNTKKTVVLKTKKAKRKLAPMDASILDMLKES